MNNSEFLQSLAERGDGSLQAWFDAEHVDNTRSAKRAVAVERLKCNPSDDTFDKIIAATIGCSPLFSPTWQTRDAIIDLLTDDGGLTNLEWLFIDSEQFRQAVSAFAFAHSDDCPTSPTQMVDWLMAPHVDAQSKAQSKDAPTLSDLYGILSDANDDFAAENDISADNVDANDENATCNNSGDFVAHDGREKLEADVRQYANPSGGTGTLGACWEKKMLEFLDRQDEITRKTEQAAWIQQANGLIHEANVRADELQTKVDELRELNEYHSLQYDLAYEDAERLQVQVDELRDELAKRDKGIARLKRQRDEARQELKKWEELTANIELPDYPFVQFQPNDKDRLINKLEAERDELKRKLDIAQRHEERADEECNECDELLGEARAERDALAADLRDCEQQRERLRQALGCAIDHAHEIVSLVNLDGEVIK